MQRTAPILALTFLLAACGGASDAPNAATEDAALAAENKAGLGGDVVELPGGEGEGVTIVEPAPIENAAGPDPAAVARADGWVGRWRGVEGLNLVVARGDEPGRYTLDMAYSLEDKGVFQGTATAEGIAFTRPDGNHVLRPTDGDATGLKWLAGKKDCLTVAAGEGYCRD